MNATRKLLLAVLGAAVALAAPTWSWGERVAESSAKDKPSWLTAAPEPTATKVFFVGIKSGAADLAAGREGAYRDAAQQAAGYVRERISGKLLIRRTAIENRIFQEINSSAHGRLEGARQSGMYWERLGGGWSRGKDSYTVWILIEYPLNEARRERERLEGADREYASRVEALCGSLVEAVTRSRPGAKVQVSGFTETVTQARHSFSRIFETSLKSCLREKKVLVESTGQADILISGEYWQAPSHVEVSAKVLDTASGRVVAARSARLPLDAVEPLWMTGEEDADGEFFARPDEPAPVLRVHGGAISVRSDPPGARIFIDGEDRGATPTEVRGVKPGLRSVALMLPNYVPIDQEVSVEADGKAAVRLALKRKTGTLSVRSLPKGAQLLIDGNKKGITPLSLDEFPTGTYLAALELKNHKRWEQTIEIGYGKTTKLDPQLIEEDGALSVLVDPPGARILLDGGAIGESQPGRPLRYAPVSAGPHTVSAEKDGRVTREWRLAVHAFQTASVTGALAESAPEEIKPFAERPLGKSLRSLREETSSVLQGLKPNRPDGMVYVNLLGGALGSGYSNVRALEVSLYGFDSTVGIGTSLIEMTGGDWKMTKQSERVSSLDPLPAPSRAGVEMVSLFPLKIYLVPFAHAYRWGDTDLVASAQFYLSACYWATPYVAGTEGQSDNNQSSKTGSIIDYGVLLHSGAAIGVRMGYVEAQIGGFSQNSASYGGFHDKKFYIAADLSLGAFIAGKQE